MDPTRISDSTPEPTNTFLGRTIDGYRIESLIGRGGMGEVYLATQLSLNRPVALKVLPQAFSNDQRFLDRFEREVDILSRLSHPSIVTVMERGEVDGRPYVVMEYVAGTSLREVMKRGPVPANEALVIVRGVLSALEHAHGQGIIHRDIKPENVLLAPGGVVKVADFGLSRLMEPDVTRLTRSHVMLGTFEYMAPEQREQAKDADERSDLYATGVVLYEMIANELPIGHFDPLSQKRPTECDSRMDRIVERSLKKSPADRFQEAAAMGNAVSRLLSTAALPIEEHEAVTLAEDAPPPAPVVPPVPAAAAAAHTTPAEPGMNWGYRVYMIAFLVIMLGYALGGGSVAFWPVVFGALAIFALLIPWRRIRVKHMLIFLGVAMLFVFGWFSVLSEVQSDQRIAAAQHRNAADAKIRQANIPVVATVAKLEEGRHASTRFRGPRCFATPPFRTG